MGESVPATNVFISYRRDDAGGHAGRLFDHLTTRLGRDSVFMDIEAIAPGADFVAEISRAIDACDAVIVVMGRRWLEPTAEGTQRLDDPDDFVRLEIAAALTHGIPVIPVLVDGGTMPEPQQLPQEIRALANRNAIVVDNVHWNEEVDRLIAAIQPGADALITCSSCGNDNPAGFRFCGFCSAALVPPAVVEERKVVSVLVCEVVGSESAGTDPEDVRSTMRPYQARLRSGIEGFGGTVERSTGDTVMAVFGAPTAHEDDPERAVRAGLAMLEAIGDLNETGEPDVAVRIGVSTGAAVVSLGARASEDEGIVTGDVVNAAGHLSTAAPIGGVVVGEPTYRATDRIFDFEPLEPIVAKGKTEPVLRWRVMKARSRFGSELTRASTSPFVGREDDLSLLRAVFSRSMRDDSLQMVTVVGEPGAGKSRLVAELRRYVEALPDLVIWRQGRCLPYGDGVTFWALGEIVKAEAGILESDGPETVRAKLDRALPPDVADREWLLARAATLAGLEAPPSDREESFTAWGRFLEQIARARPAVFVVEDLHWADEAMLEFLEHLAEWSTDLAITVVTTTRPELFERHENWASGIRNSTTISLGPLSDAETAELVGALLEQSTLSPELRSAVLDRAGGNPLYAEEFVRMLKDRGLMVKDGAIWTMVEVRDVPFPETIHSLIAARLDTLAPDSKALLHDAAVIGDVFWIAAVAAMGGRDPQTVSEAMRALAKNELVRRVRASSIEGHDEHAFWHALVKDVAYEQIPRAERAAKHRAAAEWIERETADRPEDVAELLAHHYERAIAWTEASGSTVDLGLVDAARRAQMLAGERAMGLDVERAVGLFARAVELTPTDHDMRPRVLERLGEAQGLSLDAEAAATTLQEAASLYRRQRATIDVGRVLTRLAWHRQMSQRMAGAAETIEEAITILESIAQSPELADAYALQSTFTLIAGDNQGTQTWSERSIGVSRSLSSHLNPLATAALGLARASFGDHEGLRLVNEAVIGAEQSGKSSDACDIRNNLACVLFLLEGPQAGLDVATEAREMAQRRGISESEVQSATTVVDMLYALGRWDDSLAVGEAIEATAGTDTWSAFWARLYRASIGFHRGRAVERGELEAMTASARAYGEGQSAIVSSAFAIAMADPGSESDLVGSLLEELVDDPLVGSTWNLPGFLPELTRGARACGHIEIAERLLANMPSLTPMQERARVSVLAQIAEHDSDATSAAELYAESAEGWRAMGMVPELAHSLLGAARCRIKLGHGDDALDTLVEARAIFASLSASTKTAEIDDLMRDATLGTV